MSYALITGASKGIGLHIAKELADKKYNLILAARSEKELNALAAELTAKKNITCVVVIADLSTTEGQSKLISEVIRNKYDVSVLVNNAGYGIWGRFDELTIEKQQAMMSINMMAPVTITHGLLPVLKQQAHSYILNIASTAAYQAVPTLTIYAATKSFILSFSRGLRYELKNSNVSVTCISPGATETNFMNAAGMTHPGIVKKAAKFNMQADIVAKAAVKAMFDKKDEIIPGLINSVSSFMTRLAPKALTEKIAADLYKE